MDRKVAKELLHIQGWLDRVDEVVDRGERAYLADALIQEAGDSLMMKIGEAANRLAKMEVLEPDGVLWALAVANRNFLTHQYDQINRSLTWFTLARDLPAWRESLRALVAEAVATIDEAEQRWFERPPRTPQEQQEPAALHPRRVSLEHRHRGAQIQRTPPATARAGVVARTPVATQPAPATLPAVGPHVNDHDLRVLVELDPLK